jgi:predicted RNA-binding protein with PIN domain
MPYLIDGHNLIAALPAIDLQEAQDERALIELLQPLAHRLGRSTHVHFDQGRVGEQNKIKIGRINVYFSVPPRTADDAIRAHLDSIGKQAPNWVVVSSDQEILAYAQRVGARHTTSQAFIVEFLQQESEPLAADKPVQSSLSAEDLEAWEALFREGNQET